MSAYGNADVVICFSDYFRRRMTEAWKQPVKAALEIIPPPTGQPRENPGGPENVRTPYILFLGRHEEHKGLRMLLTAFREIGPPRTLVIAGPGSQVDNKDSAIIDLGEVDDTVKAGLLAHCELLCVPSRDETFGIVYAEAMSYGKPVVALDVPPVNEIVANEKTGLLVNPGDTYELRKALVCLLDDTDMRLRMGQEARKRFDEMFSGKIVIGKITSLYTKLLAASSCR